MNPVVIAGSGLAGYTVAREFRKHDAATPLLIVTRDDGHVYSKPILSAGFSAGKHPSQMAQASAKKMAADLRAEILVKSAIDAIDINQHEIEVDGKTHRYSRLVMALGADPAVPVLTGDAKDEVITVNDLEDYTRFRSLLEGKKRVAIIGAGLIGCEFANDLVASGHQVSVVEPAPGPLGRLLPPAVGAELAHSLAELGVQWHFGVTPVSLARTGDGSGYCLTLSDQSEIATDLVLSAIGLRPRISLAQAAGIETGRGIKVNRLLQSSAPAVFALGDCAEVDGLNLPFVMPLMHAAKALAATLGGKPTPLRYPAMPVVVKTPALSLVVAPPMPVCEGVWEIGGSGKALRACYVDAAGKLRGFALCGEAVKEKNALAASIGHWLD
jgi:rubredoxin---NAD+ reductase